MCLLCNDLVSCDVESLNLSKNELLLLYYSSMMKFIDKQLKIDKGNGVPTGTEKFPGNKT